MKGLFYITLTLCATIALVAGAQIGSAEEGRGKLPPSMPMMFSAGLSASTSLPATSEEKDALILKLRARVAQLEQEVQMLRMQVVRNGVGSTTSDMMYRPMMPLLKRLLLGAKGNDVSELQKLLKDAGVYPEGLITGYFGPLTKQAVLRFESKHGLNADGEADDELMGKLKQAWNIKHEGSSTPPFFFNPSGEDGSIIICHVEGTSNAAHTLKIGVVALKAHLAHGDAVGPCAPSNNQAEDNTGATTSNDGSDASGDGQ